MHQRIEKLREKVGLPSDRSKGKVLPYLTDEIIEFIKQAPFAVLSSSDSDGNCDASPRGGLPGFIKVVNSKRLFVPDIKGNKLFQSYGNFASNPKAALIFFMPGNNKMVRVNGRVKVLEKEEANTFFNGLETAFKDENTELIQGFLLDIDEAYSHCPRALQFSNMWNIK